MKHFGPFCLATQMSDPSIGSAAFRCHSSASPLGIPANHFRSNRLKKQHNGYPTNPLIRFLYRFKCSASQVGGQSQQKQQIIGVVRCGHGQHFLRLLLQPAVALRLLHFHSTSTQLSASPPILRLQLRQWVGPPFFSFSFWRQNFNGHSRAFASSSLGECHN